MLSRNCGVLLAIPCLLLWLPLTSCSSGSEKPKQGTPAFYWQAAQETVAKRDYLKTTEHLRRVIRTENEYTQRAMAFRLAVASGLAQAYLDMASDFQDGVKANKGAQAPGRKQMGDYRVMGETRVLEFVETLMAYNKAPAQDPVVLEFPFPQAMPGEIAERKRIQGGLLPSPEALTLYERKMIERSVPEAVATAAGAPGDFAKAQAMFQSGKAQVPRNVFMHAMMESLDAQAKLFSRSVLNKPDRLFILANQGLESLKTMEASEDNKHHAENFKTLAKLARDLQP